jgi:hypothetical protein
MASKGAPMAESEYDTSSNATILNITRRIIDTRSFLDPGFIKM